MLKSGRMEISERTFTMSSAVLITMVMTILQDRYRYVGSEFLRLNDYDDYKDDDVQCMHEDPLLNDNYKTRTRIYLRCHSKKCKVMIKGIGVPVLVLDDLGYGHPHLHNMEIYQLVCPKNHEGDDLSNKPG